MARGKLSPTSLSMRSKEVQLAARADAMKKITDALEHGPKTAGDLFVIAGCLRPTLSSYMAYMHKTLRVIRKTEEVRERDQRWELGADPYLPTQDEELDRLFAVKRGTAPARQLGMPRDHLVAALFGPARGASA